MTTRSAEKRASNRKRVAEAEPTPPPSSRKASASKKKKPATSPAPAPAPDSSAEDPRSEEELEVEDTECEALIEEPVATKRKAVSNKKAGGEDSECSFVGDPFPLDEAKKRWPERYSKPSGNRSSNTANNGNDDDEMKARLHYRKARVDGCMYDLFDDAYVKASEGEDDFIGRIVELFEGTDRKMYFTAQWFFRAQDTVIKDHADLHDARRVFLSEEKNDNSLDCIVSKINIVRVAPNIDLVAKEKKIPPCDLYYDMSYSLSYSTFAKLAEENVAAGSETSSTISSDDTNNVSKEKSQYSQEVTSSGQKTNLALLDIYSGCGAMSTGLCLGANMINLNLETRWAVDINKSACESLRLNHPGTEVRNEQAENFLQLIKEWEKLCRKFSLTGKDSTIGQGIQYGGSDAEDEEPEDSNVPKGEFEVGKLLGICYGDPCKIGTVGLKFKVRWKGYGPSEDTWEPIDGLSKCQQKIEEFVRDGYKKNILPLPGTVDVICGGPPCQGISGFNRFRNTENPLKDPKNQQMVVFAEIVEFLKPKYVLMENVVDILKFAKGFLGRYALSRLVAMNYQVRLGIMAAGCYGLPQFRMRCFLWGAQPNEKLPQFPLPTHDVVVRGGAPNEFEDTTFCKSIVHEYTVKMNLDKPTYTTISIPGGKLPVFTSSFVCDGTTYAGVPGRNKKEAEQNAARTFIDTILAHSDTNMLMSPIMKSKDKLLYKGSSSGTLVMPSEAKKPIEEYSCGPNSIVVNDTSLPNVSDPADCNQANDGNPLVGSSMQHFGSPDGVLDNERKRMSNDQGNRHSKKTRVAGMLPQTPHVSSCVAK